MLCCFVISNNLYRGDNITMKEEETEVNRNLGVHKDTENSMDGGCKQGSILKWNCKYK